MRTLLSWAAVLVFFGVPIFVNFMLLTDIRHYINVVCNASGWLGFFGSYYGGIISAAVSFVILYYTIKENKKEHEENLKHSLHTQSLALHHAEIMDTQREIASRLEKFDLRTTLDLSRLSNLKKENLTSGLYELQAKHSYYTSLRNSATFLYGTDYKATNFYNSYNALMGKAIHIINETILSTTSFDSNQITETEFKKKIYEISQEIERLDVDYSEVINLGREYMNSLAVEFNNFENSILPKENNKDNSNNI